MVVTDGRVAGDVDADCPDDGNDNTKSDDRGQEEQEEGLTPAEQQIYLFFSLLSNSHYVDIEDDPTADDDRDGPYGDNGTPTDPYTGSYVIENIDGEISGGCAAAQPGAFAALGLLGLLFRRRRP